MKKSKTVVIRQLRVGMEGALSGEAGADGWAKIASREGAIAPYRMAGAAQN